MAKIAVSIPDSTLKKIDDQSNTRGITRSKYVSLALDFYADGANNYKIEIDRLNKELAEKTKELESLSIDVLPLREKVHTLSNTLTDKDHEIGTKANEVFQKDKRLHTLENTLAEKDKKIESLSKEVLLQKDEGMKIREEIEKSRSEVTKYEMALKSKEDETAFLRGHVAQLTQSISQFALRPGDEEIKKKGWWKFWR
jgi:chromosome segregation ATPase